MEFEITINGNGIQKSVLYASKPGEITDILLAKTQGLCPLAFRDSLEKLFDIARKPFNERKEFDPGARLHGSHSSISEYDSHSGEIKFLYEGYTISFLPVEGRFL